MASEMRLAAQALVEPHPHSFRSDFPPEEATARLQAAQGDGKLGDFVIAATAPGRFAIRLRKTQEDIFIGHWKANGETFALEGEFPPPRRTQRHLKGFATALTLLVAACAWAFLSGEDAVTRLSLAIFTALSILLFPYFVLGLSSQRSGREATLARAVQRALTK